MIRSRPRLWSAGLAIVLLVAAGVTVAVGEDDEPAPAPVRPNPNAVFQSRPDLRPPKVTLATLKPQATPGKVLLALKRRSGQSGPTILDERGRLLWFRPMPKGILANDFRVQRYRGAPVLTWWEGKTGEKGYGQGTWVIADESYREIARVRAGNGLGGDLHDLELTERGTALITIYEEVEADLSIVGSLKDGEAMDSVIQEVDVESGEVLWQWRSLDHVALGESYAGPPKTHRFAYDYFHINSIDEDADGDLLVSARNTWGVYKIDRPSGRIEWRLGGLRSDFALGPGVRFAWQHDARWLPDGTISIFDNQATPKVEDESTAVVIDLDERRRTATVVRELTHPDRVLSIAEGNAQALDGGGMFVGWGLARRVSELGPDSELLFDLELPADTDTYRAFRQPWEGRPADRPAVAARRSGERVTAFASWNGATEVTRWELLAGATPTSLRPVASAARADFETALEARTAAPWLAVRALAGERVLGTSEPLRAPRAGARLSSG